MYDCLRRSSLAARDFEEVRWWNTQPIDRFAGQQNLGFVWKFFFGLSGAFVGFLMLSAFSIPALRLI
jgi:hypothetical protein